MAKFNGTELVIEIGTLDSGDAISLNTNVSLSVSTSEIECTNKDSSGWKDILVGTRDWSMSGTSYVSPSSTYGLAEAWAAWEAGTAVTVNFTRGTPTSGDISLSGSAYFTSIEQTGEVDGAAEWTFSLSGSGALTKALTA